MKRYTIDGRSVYSTFNELALPAQKRRFWQITLRPVLTFIGIGVVTVLALGLVAVLLLAR